MNINISLIDPIDFSEYTLLFNDNSLERKAIFFQTFTLFDSEIQITGSFFDMYQKEHLDNLIIIGNIPEIIPFYQKEPSIHHIDESVNIIFSDTEEGVDLFPQELVGTYYQGLCFVIDYANKSILGVKIPEYLLHEISLDVKFSI